MNAKIKVVQQRETEKLKIIHADVTYKGITHRRQFSLDKVLNSDEIEKEIKKLVKNDLITSRNNVNNEFEVEI